MISWACHTIFSQMAWLTQPSRLDMRHLRTFLPESNELLNNHAQGLQLILWQSPPHRLKSIVQLTQTQHCPIMHCTHPLTMGQPLHRPRRRGLRCTCSCSLKQWFDCATWKLSKRPEKDIYVYIWWCCEFFNRKWLIKVKLKFIATSTMIVQPNKRTN